MRIKVLRQDPGRDQPPRFQVYQVKARPQDRILDCLYRIQREQDDSLGFRSSCGHGICGSDAMRINGRCALACQNLVQDFPSPEITLEPLPSFKVIRDLIVDLDPFLDKVRSVKPFLQTLAPAPDRERLQNQEDSQRLNEVIRCILCACCMGACPVVNQNRKFLGPAPLVWAFRFIFDSRDDKTLDRLARIDHPDGVWGCVNHFECTKACPKEIKVTKHINLLKREVEKHLKGGNPD